MTSIWDESGFVVNPGNLSLEAVQQLGLFKTLVVQIAYGQKSLDVPPAWTQEARQRGFKVAGWAWCVGDDPAAEARIHGSLAWGYDGFCANQEETYDAHGDVNDPKWSKPTQYANALVWGGPLALTTTPRFASDTSAFRKRGAVIQPQAFTGEAALKNGVGSYEEVNSHFTKCVEFAQAAGWGKSQIRPLIQAYYSAGVRVDPIALSAEAAACGLGGTPYTIEQAQDPEGIEWLKAVASVIGRPQPPPPPQPGGDAVLTPTHKKLAREKIADFLARAEAHRLAWFYSEIRPFKGFGVAPESQHVDDCSAYCSLAFYWAVHHVAGVWMHDPLNKNYTGWGNTDSALSYLQAHHAPPNKYLVGDMAIFGTPAKTIHMIICRKGGTDTTAIFSSNGHQSTIFGKDAPEPISLMAAKAAQPFVGVYRHPALL